MMTDRYELTQLEAALLDGTADQPAVFELFTRSLKPGRGYGVLAGLDRFLDALDGFSYTEEELAFLEEVGAIGPAARAYLTGWRFTGDISGYREGDLFFAHSPVLTVECSFGDGLLLETLVLSIFNHDSAVASAAARMATAAAGRPMIEMGSRRTEESAAISAARAAYLVGFESTSNLAAGFLHGIPTSGTAAHAFTLAHDTEAAAFDSQLAALGLGTTLLVDTYDIEAGIVHAVEAARRLGAVGPGAIRIDSGDLDVVVHAARRQLDALGAWETKIVVTSDLDEFSIEELSAAPVDVYGVGTSVATGSGHPTVGFVYKLVSVASEGTTDQHPVAKRSSGKASVGGLKSAWREYDAHGTISAERFVVTDELDHDRPGALQVRLVVDGRRVAHSSIDAIRAHHQHAKAGLDEVDLGLKVSEPRISAAPA